MPTEFFALLLGPCGRYCHGCDPPERVTRFSFFLRAFFESEHFLLACPSNFFTPSFILQRLRVIEPFFNPFRLTPIAHQKYLEPPNRGFGAEGNG